MKIQQMSSTIFLSLLVTLITVTIHARARSLLQSSCSSSCGDIPQISYPFRLKTDLASCGDPGYELSCENNRTIFEFSSGKYYVRKISYDKHLIRIVDVNLSNGTCNLPTGSLSSDEVKSDYRYRGFTGITYSNFVRCSENISDDARYRSVPCESRNGSYVYVNYNSQYSDLRSVPSSCELISTIPGDYVNVRNASYGAIMKVFADGFNLGWSVECRDCLANGHSCSVTSFTEPILFECYKSDRAKVIASVVLSGVWLSLFGITLVARYILCPIFLIVYFIWRCRKKHESSDMIDNMP